jgi:hypothetical protein
MALLFVCACAAPDGPEALMTGTDLRTVPWPSDVLRKNGKLQVAPPFPFQGDDQNLQNLANALSELDGFGTVSSIFFPLSGDTTVEPGATASLIDLNASGVVELPLLYRAETKQLAAVLPMGVVLREKTRYACVIKSGANLHPSAAMQSLIDSLPQLSGAKAATVFTTRSVTDWVPGVIADLSAPKVHVTRTFQGPDLDALFGGPVTTTRPGSPPSGGVLHDQVAEVLEGTYSSPNYLSNPPGSLGLFDGTVKSVEEVPWLLVLPRQATEKVPVVIFQHGIASDRSAILLVANDYAAHGYATFGIDELWHGSRQPGASDDNNNLTGQPGPDGIGDRGGLAITNFFDVAGDPSQGIAALDMRVIRDNLRQAAIDLMQMIRVAKSGDWSEAGVTLDSSRLVYTSESFGSILGAMVLAVDPLDAAAVLDVGGGGFLLDLVGNSPSFAPLLLPFVAGGFDQLFDVNNPDTLPVRAQMSLNLMQTLLDSGDGLSLAQGMTTMGKSVLFLEAYNDEVVANHSTEALARHWGAKQVMLPSGSPPTRVLKLDQVNAPAQLSSALVQLDPACHSMYTSQGEQRKYQDGFPPFMKLAAPMDVDNPIERAHALALGWIDSYRAGTPVVPLVP